MVKTNETEYINHLLEEEQGYYYPLSSVRPTPVNANDYYNDILDRRDEEITKLKKSVDTLNSYIATLTDSALKEKLIAHVNNLKEQIEDKKNFGYDCIDYTFKTETMNEPAIKYPYLADRKQELSRRFKARYGHMRIGYNTAEQFNEKLQSLFDDIAPDYENKLRMQTLYENKILKLTENNRKVDNVEVMPSKKNSTKGDLLYYPEDVEKPRKSTSYDYENYSTSVSLNAQVSNILSGFAFNQTILKDYLDEFGVLFIRVWPDDTGW